MWDSSSVDILVKSPCHNCDKRQKPKTCEETCWAWQEYKEKKKIAEKEYSLNKTVDHLFYEKFTRHSRKK